MKCKDRMGRTVQSNGSQDTMLRILYQTKGGRNVLRVLIQPWVSKLVGYFLDSHLSTVLIKPFIKGNDISMTEYESIEYHSYNDFFTRRIKNGCRNICKAEHCLIAPCDSRLTVYPISKDLRFTVKNTEYTMHSLLRSKKLAKRYEEGLLLIFRLGVEDYHRYCYVDDGIKSKNYRIPGVFHTVNPIANDVYPIYKENTREFSILNSAHFGHILMMEVGALLVGRIVNKHEEKKVTRGEEKGYFEFGGSTVILCLEKNRVKIDDDIWQNSRQNIETCVKQGEKIGKSSNDERIHK